MSVEIIAECGINHQGSVAIAKQMVFNVGAAGCKIAKFQMFDKEDYTDDRIKTCWLSQDSFKEIKKYCDKIGIEFLCTPEKPAHVDFLEKLGVKRYKVGNNHLADLLLLERIEKTKKPVFLSANEKDALYTPFGEACDLDKARNILYRETKVLYCVPKYPPKPEELKLRILRSLDHKFDGISNHYPSILPSLIAIAYGAKVIETHVMISSLVEFGLSPIDAPVSITFSELGQLVFYAKQMEEMIWGKQ